MNVLSFVPDHRIRANSVLIDVTIGEYLPIAKEILRDNEFQRKRVIKSSISELLKNDLLKGCTIPPIVLAIKNPNTESKGSYESFCDKDFVEQVFDKRQLLIIDGLQRSLVMLDLERELQRRHADEDLKLFYSRTIRIEAYFGINKLGILYRMLTLNTGQTTMSTRHLVEILYLDYINIEFKGIKLVTEKENITVAKDYKHYNFKDIVDGFNAYIEGEEIPTERAEILENIKSLKNINISDEDKNEFESFVFTFKMFIESVDNKGGHINLERIDFESSEVKLNGPLFGNNVVSIFKKSQSLTGFGAAMSFLKKHRSSSLEKIVSQIEHIDLNDENDFKDNLKFLVKHFDYIRDHSKRVGNDQRYYFRIFYQSLFDNELHTFLKFGSAIEVAYKRTKERIEF